MEVTKMLGFLIGTVCLVALVKVVRHGRCGGWRYAHGCGYGGGYDSGCGGWHDRGHGHGHGRWGGGWSRGGFGPGFMLRGLFARLETTPGQEKVIRDAF